MAIPLSQELKDSAARARASVGRRKKKSYDEYLKRSKTKLQSNGYNQTKIS